MRGGLAILALAGALVGHAAEDDASRQLEEVVRRLNALDVWIDEAGRRLANQERRLAEADRGVANVAERIHDLERRSVTAQAALSDLGGRRDGLDERRREQAALVAEHLRAAWRLSRRRAARTILEQGDGAALERLTRYHGLFAEARAEAAAALADTRRALDDNEQALRRERENLRAAQRSLAGERDALQGEREKRRELVAGLRGELSDKNEERSQLDADRRRLAALIAELASEARRAPAGDGLGVAGALPWPVVGEVHRRFGQRRASGRTRWQGMLIRAPLGSDVRAVAAGRVVFADWLRGFGLLTIVDHGDEHMSLYGYADALYKRLGDRVEGGEAIAAVGQSGGQAKAALYFEVRRGGEPIDPRGWLQARAE